MACVFDVANFNSLCQSLSREEKVIQCLYFVSLHDYFLLKVIKYSELHKSGGKGRKQEMRGKAHLHLQVANANGPNDLTARICGFLSAAICRQKKYICLLDRLFYIPIKCHSIRHLINHHGSILKFLRIFSNCSEQRLGCFV